MHRWKGLSEQTESRVGILLSRRCYIQQQAKTHLRLGTWLALCACAGDDCNFAPIMTAFLMTTKTVYLLCEWFKLSHPLATTAAATIARMSELFVTTHQLSEHLPLMSVNMGSVLPYTIYPDSGRLFSPLPKSALSEPLTKIKSDTLLCSWTFREIFDLALLSGILRNAYFTGIR